MTENVGSLSLKPDPFGTIKMGDPELNIPITPADLFPPERHAIPSHNLPVMTEYMILHE